MNFHHLGENARADIVEQVGAMIDAFSIEGKLGEVEVPGGLSLFESCREVIIDLPDQWLEVLRSGESPNVEKWIRGRLTWYHQLQSGGQPFGFARSIEVEKSTGKDFRVIEVVPSLVAREFQRAVEFLDTWSLSQEPSVIDTVVVLLRVPRYSFYGFEIGATATISAVCPFFRERLGVEAAILDREALLAALAKLPTSFGATVVEK